MAGLVWLGLGAMLSPLLPATVSVKPVPVPKPRWPVGKLLSSVARRSFLCNKANRAPCEAVTIHAPH